MAVMANDKGRAQRPLSVRHCSAIGLPVAITPAVNKYKYSPRAKKNTSKSSSIIIRSPNVVGNQETFCSQIELKVLGSSCGPR
jgi:hypothetical protein